MKRVVGDGESIGAGVGLSPCPGRTGLAVGVDEIDVGTSVCVGAGPDSTVWVGGVVATGVETGATVENRGVQAERTNKSIRLSTIRRFTVDYPF